MENNDIMQDFAPQVEEPQQETKGNFFSNLLANKTMMIGGIVAVVAVVVVVALLIALFGASYKTPVKDYVKHENAKKYVDGYTMAVDDLNGFTAGEFKAIFKLLKSTDDYEEGLEAMQELFEEGIETLKDEYGDNYKFSFKIEDKDELDKKDLKAYEDEIQEKGKKINDFVKGTKDEDFDWDEFSESLGLNKKDAKTIVKKMGKIAEVWKKADITKGFELDVNLITKGKELDEPKETEMKFYGVKINGKWIDVDAIDAAFALLPGVGGFNLDDLGNLLGGANSNLGGIDTDDLEDALDDYINSYY